MKSFGRMHTLAGEGVYGVAGRTFCLFFCVEERSSVFRRLDPEEHLGTP